MATQTSMLDEQGNFHWNYLKCKDLQFPSQENFKTFHVYREGQVLVRNGSAAELRRLCEELNLKDDGEPGTSRDLAQLKAAGCMIEIVSDDASFVAARTAYYVESSRRESDFKRALFEREGLSDNPKVEACYSKAYERGHSAGLAEVASIFIDLAELIR